MREKHYKINVVWVLIMCTICIFYIPKSWATNSDVHTEDIDNPIYPNLPVGTPEESHECRMAMRKFSTSKIDSSFLVNFDEGSYHIWQRALWSDNMEKLKEELLSYLDEDKCYLSSIENRDKSPFNFGLL